MNPDAPGPPGGVTGVDVIEHYVKSLPNKPGVYRMVNKNGDVLYVGKAKALKKRVSAYTKPERQTLRIRRMIHETADMEFVTTRNEAEALLLEANFIKKLSPRYNILLRDDKSFPSILITGDHPFPQVLKHRGAKAREGEYFGPFASAGAVNQTLAVLQRAFLLRTCSDNVFANRKRPCLLYQIKRCSAPCVGKISEAEYAELVDQSRRFLTGQSKEIQDSLVEKMEQASDNLEYEEAALYRDRIAAMNKLHAQQDVIETPLENADVIALHQTGGQTCIQVFFFRSGANFGNRAYFPKHGNDAEPPDILEAFIGQFYTNKIPPPVILLSHKVAEPEVLAEALGVRAERKVGLQVPHRGAKRELVEHALVNARGALARRLSENASQRKLLEQLADALDMETTPERIEVFDNSHISGTGAVGAMIVAGPEGFMKNQYRKFNIRTVQPKAKRAAGGDSATGGGDDYAMMREVLTRRFSRILKEDPDRDKGQWPDLVLVDGGRGQLNTALEVFADLGVDDVTVAGIAKGPDRHAGREKIYLPERAEFTLDARDPVLYFIQRLRDEAHRFAIGSHRAQRKKGIRQSRLDAVPGIGPGRKRALLHHFGSAQMVEQASVEDLQAVDGISRSIAERIYNWFHPDD